MMAEHNVYHSKLLCNRFGAGYTLQAKVGQLSEAANTPQVTPQSSAGSLLSSLPGPKSDDDRNPPLLQQQNMSAFPMTVDTTALKRFIEQSFDSARLKEEHQVTDVIVIMKVKVHST